MGTAPELTRKYKMGDGTLIQKADHKTNIATRDINDLKNRGIDVGRIANLKTARDLFSNLPTDIELLGNVTVAVMAKEASRDTVVGTVQGIRSMAENKFGTVGYYKSFGFKNLTELSDDQLLRAARRVVRVATTLLSQLTGEGLTAANIATLTTQADAFDSAIDTVEAAEDTRDIKTQERILAGNNVYEQMMKIANAGQSFYRNIDEAKYNDYLVNDEPDEADAPPAP